MRVCIIVVGMLDIVGLIVGAWLGFRVGASDGIEERQVSHVRGHALLTNDPFSEWLHHSLRRVATLLIVIQAQVLVTVTPRYA